MENLIGYVIITTEEYKGLVEDSLVLNMVKEHASNEEYLSDYRIREMIGVPRPEKNGVPKPEKKEGEE